MCILSRSSLSTLTFHVRYLVHPKETRRRKLLRLPNIKLSDLISELGGEGIWEITDGDIQKCHSQTI